MIRTELTLASFGLLISSPRRPTSRDKESAQLDDTSDRLAFTSLPSAKFLFIPFIFRYKIHKLRKLFIEAELSYLPQLLILERSQLDQRRSCFYFWILGDSATLHYRLYHFLCSQPCSFIIDIWKQLINYCFFYFVNVVKPKSQVPKSLESNVKFFKTELIS